jgi:HSP20 family molecular chaperone IbpA
MLSTIDPSFIRTFIQNPVFNDMFSYGSCSLLQYGQLNFTQKIENDKIHYSIDLPGVKQKELNLTYENNQVNIKGKRQKADFNYYFILPKKYNQSTAEATLHDGVLKLVFKIRKEMAPQKISININKKT